MNRYPESKHPLDLGIDLCTRQLGREGVVGVAGPWIPLRCHLPPPEWMDTAADKSAEEVYAHQPISKQTLENVAHRLQLMDVFPSHPVPLNWAGRRGAYP
jgi:hypothetical protein